ncbi:MAG: ParA family protein [Deltaproteobacteria bacterium]|nr:ParA family protein [Deltaproteobacteria bacterium]
MGRVLAIANQKGGVGKTTTAVNLGAALAQKGAQTLVVDLDPQANATSGLGLRGHQGTTLYDVLVGGAELSSAVVGTGLSRLLVVPGSRDLVAAEIELLSADGRERVLRRAIEAVSPHFDVVLIDCPPSLGILTINALTAADGILIPLQAEYYALEGVAELLQAVERIQAALNPGLEIDGVVMTMFDVRNNLAHAVADEARKHFGDRLFLTFIPRNVRLSESPSHGVPAITYDPQSKGAQSYVALAEEIVSRGTFSLSGTTKTDERVEGLR